MNALKSLYVTVYMVAAMSITVFAAQMLVATQDFLTWGGVLLVYAPFVLVISWLMIFRNVPRTSARLPVVVVMGLIGVIASLRGYSLGGSGTAPALAVLGYLGFLVYDFWYSSFRHRHSQALEVGQALPEFELVNTTGNAVSSSSLTDRPCVWIFYRGNWCPLCMAQIREIADDYRQLEELGVRVALISPQPHRYTKSLAKKFDVTFDFLTDTGNRAAEQLGIEHRNGLPVGIQALGYASDTVLPTVIITARGGEILWVHETDNYRVRPEPETYLAVLRRREAAA
jgi:peroxiredoxin